MKVSVRFVILASLGVGSLGCASHAVACGDEETRGAFFEEGIPHLKDSAQSVLYSVSGHNVGYYSWREELEAWELVSSHFDPVAQFEPFSADEEVLPMTSFGRIVSGADPGPPPGNQIQSCDPGPARQTVLERIVVHGRAIARTRVFLRVILSPSLGGIRVRNAPNAAVCGGLESNRPPNNCNRDAAYSDPDLGSDFVPPGFDGIPVGSDASYYDFWFAQTRLGLGRQLSLCYRDASNVPDDCEDSYVNGWQMLRQVQGVNWNQATHQAFSAMLFSTRSHIVNARISRGTATWLRGGQVNLGPIGLDFALIASILPNLDPFNRLLAQTMLHQACRRWHQAWEQNNCSL